MLNFYAVNSSIRLSTHYDTKLDCRCIIDSRELNVWRTRIQFYIDLITNVDIKLSAHDTFLE